MAGTILCVSDKHLSVVLNPALATQDVVNTGRHLVPLKVVPKPERDKAHEGSSQPALGNKWAMDAKAPVFLYRVSRPERSTTEPGTSSARHGSCSSSGVAITGGTTEHVWIPQQSS